MSCEKAKKVTMVFDMTEWKMAHVKQIAKVKALVYFFQNHYPGVLEQNILIRAPSFFESAWKIIKGVMSQNLRKRTIWAPVKVCRMQRLERWDHSRG